MPFGLCNGPATFQRLMQQCLNGPLTESTLVYLDDVIVFSQDFRTHLEHLGAVFKALERYTTREVPVILQTGEVSETLCQWRGSGP